MVTANSWCVSTGCVIYCRRCSRCLDGQALSVAKSLVNLSSVSGKGGDITSAPRFEGTVAALAVHPSARVRQRAAHALVLLSEQGPDGTRALRGMDAIAAALMPGSALHDDAMRAPATHSASDQVDLTKARRACELYVICGGRCLRGGGCLPRAHGLLLLGVWV